MSLRLNLLLFLLTFSLTACNKEAKQSPLKSSRDASLCQFSAGDCIKKVGDTQLKFNLSPVSAPSEKPLTLTLSSTLPITNVNLRLEGRDMFMGIIPVKMQQSDDTTYIGNFVYGSCSSGYMVWRGFVSFSLNGQDHTVIVDFLADDNG
ncbi:hypothetical protein C9I43_07120 [Shewanella morhuae]|uniref:Lipoprotein n=1 Tax=Shewanella morhuae TaxID=365591 RepID=A0ABX5HTS3_9GAMM|nr:hypothetical protein [Shewanella morhuae]PTA50288.1 hypothetical protein C9I43_07120 [Shewanella morhuae]SIR35379.1 hypothetical protein SAMN05421840_1177 [Shewanella morhuae]